MADKKVTDLPSITNAELDAADLYLLTDVSANVSKSLAVSELDLRYLGPVASSRLPTPTVTLLGGVKAIAPVTNQFMTAIDTTGTPQLAQPAFTDISGTLAVNKGGTGVTSVTTTPTANAWIGLDASKNLKANNFDTSLLGLTTSSVNSVVVLTNTSNFRQYHNGAGTTLSGYQLPDCSTIALGTTYYISKAGGVSGSNAAGVLALTTSAGIALGVVTPGCTAVVTSINNNGTNLANQWMLTDFNGGNAWLDVSSSVSILGALSNPTVGTSTFKCFWKRNGAVAEVIFSFIQTVAGSAGSGSYGIGLPNYLIADTTVTSSSANASGASSTVVGSGMIQTTTAATTAISSPTIITCSSINTTTYQVNLVSSTLQTTAPWSSTLVPISGAAIWVNAHMFIPINAWKWAGV